MRTRGLLLLVMALAAGSCRRHDYRTVTIHVPAMKNRACLVRAANAVAAQSGVLRDTIEPRLDERTIEVTYDSIVLSLKNIEGAIAAAGFEANGVPPDAEAVAALPPECR